MKKIILIVILSLSQFSLILAKGEREHPMQPLDDYRQEFQSTPLQLTGVPRQSEKAKTYFRFYNLDTEDVPHYFGYFPSRGYRICAHLFIPPEAKSTVYLIHGYLLHSASYHHLIKALLSNGFAVAAFDLPGHGFSSGERAHITNFQEYAQVFQDFIACSRSALPPLRGVIGLSTGSSVILEYCRHFNSPFPKHIIGAPLIRSDKWALSRFGNNLLKDIIKTVPTLQRDTTSNAQAKKFVQKTDPLKIKKVPLTWVQALYSWHDSLHQQTSTIPGDFLVLQGDNDVVVQWKYNISFLEKKLNHPQVEIIKGAKHELYLEEDQLRETIFALIMHYLKN